MNDAPRLSRHKSVKDALAYVAKYPEMTTDPIDTPVWELVARVLFEIANNPNPRIRGSLTRATKAQKIIADRLVGTRRAGTHPAQVREQELLFVDLTQRQVQPGETA